MASSSTSSLATAAPTAGVGGEQAVAVAFRLAHIAPGFEKNVSIRDIAANASSVPSSSSPSSSAASSSTAEADTHHRQGLFARRAFAAGDVVLKEVAASRVPVDSPAAILGIAFNLLRPQERSVGVIPKPPQEPEALDLFPSATVQCEFGPGAQEASGRMAAELDGRSVEMLHHWARAVQPYLVGSESLASGVEPSINIHLTCSKANHSCVPNCLTVFDANGRFQHIVAVRSIAANEELCVTYWTDMLTDTVSTRQATSSTSQGWLCWCTRCSSDLCSSAGASTLDFPHAQEVFADKPEAFQSDILQYITAIRNLVRTRPSDVRRRKIAAAARTLFDNLGVAKLHTREPSLTWFAASWILRTMADDAAAAIAAAADKAFLGNVCTVLWNAYLAGCAVHIPAVRALTCYWIFNTVQRLNMSLKSLPVALQSALGERDFKRIRQTISTIEKLPSQK